MYKTHHLLSFLLSTALLLSACSQAAATSDSPQSGEMETREAILNATVAALNATLTPTITPSQTPSLTPTITPTPTETLTPTPTLTPTQSAADFVRSARILLYEDVAQSMGVAPQFIKKALDEAGYTYTTTEGLIGRLDEQINQDWDLVIVAAEMKSSVQGEFFLDLDRRLRQGSAVILETWVLDQADLNQFSYMLSACGLEVQGDYYESTDRGVRWTNPAHPLLQSPNPGIDLTDFSFFWDGDLGDLIRKKPGSTAEIVGSSTGSDTENGLLTTCMDGRLVLQTFSTHDHKEDDMVALWQNYIAYALEARYRYKIAQEARGPDPLDEFKHQAYISMTRRKYSGYYSTFVPWLPYYQVLTMQQVKVNNPRPTGLDLILGYEHSIARWQGYSDTPMLLGHKEISWYLDASRDGTVVLLEKTFFDNPANTESSRVLLQNCGLRLLDNYTISQHWPENWLIGSNHPFFQGLHQEITFTRLRTADRLGALLARLPEDQIPPGAGTVEFLAGVDPALTGGIENGFITSCRGGRLIIVSLDSEQYDQWSMFQIWENLIDYALRTRMAHLAANPTSTPSPTP